MSLKRLSGLIIAVLLVHFLHAQTCSTTPSQELRSNSLTYIKLSNDPADHRYRFFYTVTARCGLSSSHNPLIIEDPLHADAGAVLNLIADSTRSILGPPDPCVTFPSIPCLSVYYYHGDTTLPNSIFGYIASIFDCCRPVYTNLFQNPQGDFYSDTPPLSGPVSNCTASAGWATGSNGIASVVRIPPFADYPVNSSPQFIKQDTVLFLCKDSTFASPVSATDPDGDSIAYHFVMPMTFAMTWNCYSGCIYTMVTHPVFPLLYYSNPPYTVDQPVGSGVTLDQHTGVVAGAIHDTGTYIIAISACEYRNGVLLDSVTRDLMIRVYDCALLNVHTKAGFPAVQTQCTGYTAAFINNSTPDSNDYNRVRSFLWSFGDGDTSTQVSPVHTYTDTGTYNVRLIVFPGLYCADTAFGKAIIYPYVYPNFTFTDSCSDQPMSFTNTSVATDSSGGILSDNWKVIQVDSMIEDASGTNFTYTFKKAPLTYSVILTVTTSRGCVASDTQYVDIYRSPLPLPFKDTLLAIGQPLQLEANDGDNNNNENGTFLWSPSNGLSNPNIPDPVLTGTTAGTYTVKISNMWGCTLEDSFHVTYYAGPAIYLPSAFTPNGDGRNDIFRPLAVGVEGGFQLRVFSRYGLLVFESGGNGLGWDGSVGGRPAPAGTYVWEATAVDYRGKRIERRGTVELIR